MNLKQLDDAIFWHEHVRETSRDKAQKARCNERIERFMRERTELLRAQKEAELSRGVSEQQAWNDTRDELR